MYIPINIDRGLSKFTYEFLRSAVVSLSLLWNYELIIKYIEGWVFISGNNVEIIGFCSMSDVSDNIKPVWYNKTCHSQRFQWNEEYW